MNLTAEFDVVYGATGFTGRLVSEYLLARYGPGGELRWALARRPRPAGATNARPADTPSGSTHMEMRFGSHPGNARLAGKDLHLTRNPRKSSIAEALVLPVKGAPLEEHRFCAAALDQGGQMPSRQEAAE